MLLVLNPGAVYVEIKRMKNIRGEIINKIEKLFSDFSPWKEIIGEKENKSQ